MSAIVKVAFHGDAIEATADGQWAIVKRLCENLGVDIEGQRKKLKGEAWAVTEMISATGPDGKNYETFCIHRKSLAMWLVTIKPSKVRPEIREKLIAYQREAADVLAAHFGGTAVVPVAEARDLSEVRSMVASLGTALMTVVNTQAALMTTQAAMMESLRELTSGSNGPSSGRSFANQIKVKMTAFATYSGDGSAESIRSWRTTGHAKLRRDVEFFYTWSALPAHRRTDALTRLDDMVRLARRSSTQDTQQSLFGAVQNDAIPAIGDLPARAG